MTASRFSRRGPRGVGRRQFLVQTGLTAGGIGLLGRPAAGEVVPQSPAPAGHAGSPTSATAHRGSAAAANGQGGETQAPAFSFQGVTMPLRKSFHDYSASDLALLSTAYDQMKKLPEGDPRYWLNQANIHASHCGGNFLEVHQSWLFTVWHRCYLFFYERILAKLSGNPSAFGLPYWDWSGHPSIPNTQFLEALGQNSPFFDTSSPLYNKFRFPVAGTTFSTDPLSTNVAAATSSSYLASIQNDTFDDFCGSDPDDPNGRGPGDLESNPHNSVHTWTGIDQPPYNDMGNLTTAARDLLFFLHHANVDRQFTLWLATEPALPPPSSPWYSQWFNCWDENGNAVSVTVQDALTYMAGNYQPPQESFTLVDQPQEVPLGGQPRSVVGTKNLESIRARIASAGTKGAPGAARRRKVQIRFEGVDAPHDVPVILHVFLNKPDATLKDLNGANFVGTIHLLPSSAAHGRRHRMHNVTLDITQKADLLRQDVANQGPMVTLVPAKTGPAGGAAPTVRFKKISVITNGHRP
jgi:polyphenol oxidase